MKLVNFPRLALLDAARDQARQADVLNVRGMPPWLPWALLSVAIGAGAFSNNSCSCVRVEHPAAPVVSKGGAALT
ncbi:MAG TPA: hypothetical protein PKW35_00890 [Nannocystaceae bacterium]|nr:hypothetical protein [Nannocystaceae bacterium]